MQIVIDIDEKEYKRAMKRKDKFPRDLTRFESIITNGTPLPKGHGRLIDADAVLEEPIGDTYRDIDIAETIIEAESED